MLKRLNSMVLVRISMIILVAAAGRQSVIGQQTGAVPPPVSVQQTVSGRQTGDVQQTLSGQQLILINGAVIDAVTEEALPNVQFTVPGRGGGVTDGSGLFSVFAVMYDTIEFRMIGYKPSILAIGSTFTASQYLVLIPMVTDTLVIGEVIVIPQLPNLRSVAEGSTMLDSREFGNARENISISVHQGLTGVNKMGDPGVNYELLRKQHQIEAYEKGGIPGDRMISVSPFMIIPAIYLLMNGLPEKPPAPLPKMTNREFEQLRKAYRDLLNTRK
jgi:hypothetical protein